MTVIADASGGLWRKRDVDREGGLGEFVCHNVRLWVDTNASTRCTSIRKRLSTERWLIEVLSLGLFSKDGEIGVCGIPEDALDVLLPLGGLGVRTGVTGEIRSIPKAAHKSAAPPDHLRVGRAPLPRNRIANRAIIVVAPPRPHLLSECKKCAKVNENSNKMGHKADSTTDSRQPPQQGV